MKTFKRILTLSLILVALALLPGCNVFRPTFNDDSDSFYTITVTANEGGTAIGEGVFSREDQVTVEATASIGYTFVNWTKGVIILSTDAIFTFSAVENANLVANFEPLPESYVLWGYHLQNDSGDNVVVTEFKEDGTYIIYNYTFDGTYYDSNISTGTYTVIGDSLTMHNTTENTTNNYAFNILEQILTTTNASQTTTHTKATINDISGKYMQIISNDIANVMEFKPDKTYTLESYEYSSSLDEYEYVILDGNYQVIANYLFVYNPSTEKYNIYNYTLIDGVLTQDNDNGTIIFEPFTAASITGKFYNESIENELYIIQYLSDNTYINILGDVENYTAIKTLGKYKIVNNFILTYQEDINNYSLSHFNAGNDSITILQGSTPSMELALYTTADIVGRYAQIDNFDVFFEFFPNNTARLTSLGVLFPTIYYYDVVAGYFYLYNDEEIFIYSITIEEEIITLKKGEDDPEPQVMVPYTGYTLTISQTNNGVVIGNGQSAYDYGQEITLQATPSSGYYVHSWIVNGVIYAGSSTHVITITQNTTVRAIFRSDDNLKIQPLEQYLGRMTI
jgi:hypothetical protein